MNIKEILNLLNYKQEKDIIINKFETNSKFVEKDDCFIAINNGHKYVKEAIKNGAKVVIVSNNKEYDCLTVNVNDTVLALKIISKYIRNLYDIPLIAITGSCGKTTTKELIYYILSNKYNVLKSEKNYNNHIGLPLTLLKLNDSYEVVVVEMGMNHKNEIKYLSDIAKPNYGIITNIGSAHIGNLGSKKNILNAKLEILNGLNGILLVNKNDKYLNKVKYSDIIKVSDKLLNVKNIKYFLNRTEFDIDNTHFVFNMPGKLVLNDLFIAIKIGLLFNVDIEDICKSVNNFKNISGRLNIVSTDITVIDDSYNSNYEALINSLEILKSNHQHKIIILGDMLELGKFSKKYHKKINSYLKKIKNKDVLLLGEYTKYIKGVHFKSIEDINNYLKKHIKKEDIIYIKGSRKMNLDKIKTQF